MIRLFSARYLSLMLLVYVCIIASCSATVIQVSSFTCASINDGIAAAAVGDTIVLSAGVYYSNSTSVRLDKNVTIIGYNAVISPGRAVDAIVMNIGCAGARIFGISIVNCSIGIRHTVAYGNVSLMNANISGCAIGVYVSDADLSVENTTISFCSTMAIRAVNSSVNMHSSDIFSCGSATTTDMGGGVCAIGCRSIITIEDCVISKCTALTGGGIGLDSGANLSIVNTTLSMNSATKVATGYIGGGGLYAKGVNTSVVITSSTFNENTGTTAGGLALYYFAKASVYDAIFVGNVQGYDGYHAGAVHLIDSVNIEFHRCSIVNNTSYGNGAGIHVSTATCTVFDSVISGNLASNGLGGAIVVYLRGFMTMMNSIITDNRAKGNAAVFVSTASGFSCSNCTIIRNSCTGGTLTVTGNSQVWLSESEISDGNVYCIQLSVYSNVTASSSRIQNCKTAGITLDWHSIVGM